MTELKRRRKSGQAHHDDPDVRQAAFRADLDCMIEDCIGEDEVYGDDSVRLWTHGKVRRYRAWLPLCRSMPIDTLLRFGVAPVLLLKVQLGAAWMFLAIGLLSVAATVENVYAWRDEEMGSAVGTGATSNRTFDQASFDELGIVTMGIVSMGFTNGSIVLQMTTLGWRLSSVSATSVRLQNWLVAVQLILVLFFLVWVRVG